MAETSVRHTTSLDIRAVAHVINDFPIRRLPGRGIKSRTQHAAKMLVTISHKDTLSQTISKPYL